MKILISLILLVFTFTSCHQAPVHQAKFHWKPYSKEAVLDALAHHSPIVIDFFAEWCPNCHELDDVVFSRPEIQAKLAKITALRVDLTNQEDPQVQRIAQEYGIEGVPTVVFIDSHGQEVSNSRVIGFVTPQEFSQALALLNIFK
jgi:thiol:disulfide interchange protein DsbD